jgi:hypothetical protein
MKKMNLLLVLTLLACYSGFGSKSAYSSIPSSNPNCHSIKKEGHSQNKHESDVTIYYLNGHVMNHGAFRCCFESLPNAPQKDHLTFKDLILDASFINNSNLETSKHLNSSLSVNIREHDPPNLYLSNSSLLL